MNNSSHRLFLPCLVLAVSLCLAALAAAQDATLPSFEELKAQGARQSSYRQAAAAPPSLEALRAPTANLADFRRHVEPALRKACYPCHGSQRQEGEFRLDALDPDLLHGKDASWWVEVFRVLSNGEMPPQDEEQLSGESRQRIVEWLSSELQSASRVRRNEQAHSSFRRLTRYEYNFALQDLTGLSYEFAADLPPESVSDDGFRNSSEMLQMSTQQLDTYRSIARRALQKATVRGERPLPIYYAVTMDFRMEKERERYESELKKLRKRFADNPEKLKAEIDKRRRRRPRGAHYKNLETGFAATARWSYGGARYARTPTTMQPKTPGPLPNVAVIPRKQRLIVDLGDHLPDRGDLRLRIRATAISEDRSPASLRLYFGHQASNNSRADERVGLDTEIQSNNAREQGGKFYELDIPLSEVVRNPYRGIQKLGQTPNPAEYVMLVNTSPSAVDIQIDYIEVIAPHHEQWPPQSHRRILGQNENLEQLDVVRGVLAPFMTRAWRRPPSAAELDQKLELYQKLLPHCDDAQEALIEVLAGVLTSPKFLYVSQRNEADEYELATRLSIFLWSSLPDEELLRLADDGELSKPSVLVRQAQRMLADPKGKRFSEQFVRQWLGIDSLNHVSVDPDLRDAMQQEPIEFFANLLSRDGSAIDLLHSDYVVVNERLAQHYGLTGVRGGAFRQVELPKGLHRGGLLTQAGLLALNSDGKESHPLKRGVWLLESILNDPPPPPPPAVPEIDLADPEILKLSLKERMEDHRNDPACMSCHQRIDPWGIAFENYDALGRYRSQIAGKPVDANGVLFNGQELRGMDGLKRFMLAHRQDQFARALTQKMLTYALGRPLSFADRAEVETITSKFRQRGDRLASLVEFIVASDLFLPNHTAE